MNPKLQPLMDRASVALKAGLGGVVNVALGPDGQVLIGDETPPCISYNPPGFAVTANCTITFPGGVAAVEKFEAANDFGRLAMLENGEVRTTGDQSLAMKLGGILAAAA